MSNESEAEEAEADADVEDSEESVAADEEPAADTEAEDAEEAAEEAAAEDDEAEGEDAEEAADESGFQDGDFVELDYTARTVEGDDLVDTTDPEVVEEEGIEADQEFAPRTIVLGEGHIFDAVEDDITGAAVGDTGSVVVPAAEAFGEYDDEQVRTVSADKIPEDDRYPGAQVQIEGEEGHVETIIGGRARVDFNHPIAGEDIRYEWEVVGEVTDRQAKAEGLLSMMLDVDLDVWFQTDTVEEEQLVETDEEDEEGDDEDEAAEPDDEDEEPPEPETELVEVEKESLYIDADPQLTMNQQWMMGKQQIAQQLIELLDVDRVVVQEVIEGMGMGMPGMMGMGGGGGGDIEAALEEADIDADELAEGLEE
jgi:FKBP-type peptidyl-prolyl cis-trans isomerase SlyD